MKYRMLLLSLVLAAAPLRAEQIAPVPVSAQDGFHALVVQTYDWDRSKFSDDAYRSGKEAAVNTFWRTVMADPKKYSPLLMAELARQDQTQTFYMDGASLLSLADESQAGGEAVLAALLRVDLNKTDFNPAMYMLTVNRMMARGLDTTDAAIHFLDYRENEVMLPLRAHVFYYDRTESLVWMLFGMDEHRFVGKLVTRLETETDKAKLSALIHAIWETVTPEGRAALERYAELRGKPSDARKFAREMLTHKSELPSSDRFTDHELRELRRDIAKNPFHHDSYTEFHRYSDELAGLPVTAPAANTP